MSHAAIEAFVYWAEPDDDLFASGGNAPINLLAPNGTPDRLIVDLAALLGLHLELNPPANTTRRTVGYEAQSDID